MTNDLVFFLVLSIIKRHKPQGTNYKGQQSPSTLIVQLIRSFVWDLKGR